MGSDRGRKGGDRKPENGTEVTRGGWLWLGCEWNACAVGSMEILELKSLMLLAVGAYGGYVS